MGAQSIRFVGSWVRAAVWVFAAGVSACGAAAGAHQPDARLDIVATPPSVTRGTAALSTFASYRMTITSQTSVRLDSIKLEGTVAVQGLPAGSTASATLFGSEGAACALSAGTLECTVPGALAGAGSALSFTLTLRTPSAGSAISVTGKASFIEHLEPGSTDSAGASTALTEPSADSVSTFVPAVTVDTKLFSGTNTVAGVVGAIPIVDANAVPPINDPFTTTVIVPAGSAATTAAVAEREVLQSCSANPRCFESALAIPGSFDFLTIILRRDRTTLNAFHSGQSAIDNAIVKYFPDDDPAQPDKFIIVPNCSVVPGGVPTPKNPCIAARKVYPSKSSRKSPVPLGLEGDWEFVIFAVDNGRYIN